MPTPLGRAPPADPAGPRETTPAAGAAVAASRRRLLIDALGISLSTFAFGLVYGLSARQHDFSIVDALAMSVFVLAGASQFAAIGLFAQGLPWVAIVGLTALINARHLLYSTALAPWFAGRSLGHRAAAAHVLTDEAFALSLPHFRRVGGLDETGYWLAGLLVALPWIVATALGFAGGELLPDTRSLGLDVVFPAAMAGLATALITGRRDVVAAAAAVAIGLSIALLTQPAVGIIVGGVCGPIVAMLLTRDRFEDEPAAGPASEIPS